MQGLLKVSGWLLLAVTGVIAAPAGPLARAADLIGGGIAWSEVEGNNGDSTSTVTANPGTSIPFDLTKYPAMTGTTLMNYKPSYLVSGRNTYMYHGGAVVDGENLSDRYLTFRSGSSTMSTRTTAKSYGFSDLLIDGGGLRLKDVNLSTSAYSTDVGAYIHLGVLAGATYDFVKVKDDGTAEIDKDGKYGLDSKPYYGNSGWSTGYIGLEHSLMSLAGGTTIQMNNGSGIYLQRSAMMMIGGLAYEDSADSSVDYHSSDYYGNYGKSYLKHSGPNSSWVQLSDQSLFRLQNPGRTATRDSQIDTIEGISASGNSSIEIFSPQNLPNIRLGNSAMQGHIDETTNPASIDHSRLLLGKPGVYDEAGALDPEFDSYATMVNVKKPDFSTFLVGGADYDRMSFQFESMSLYSGASLIGYGTLSSSRSGGNLANGDLHFEYGSILMPAVSMLKFNKTVLDGTIPTKTPSTADWLADEYRYTYVENTPGTGTGHGIGMQTVDWMYDSKGNLRTDLVNSFGPGAMKLTGNVRMENGSTLMLVAAGSQISTLEVTGTMKFKEGSTIRVLGQSFSTDGQWVPIDVSNAVVVTTGAGVTYVDADGNELTELPSSVFRSYIGTSISGQIKGNTIVLSANTDFSPYDDTVPVDSGQTSFANWTVGTVIPQYYATPTSPGSVESPKTYQMLNAYRAYTASADPSKSTADLTAEAWDRINPISITYMQQQAMVVDSTVRGALMERLSAQRPNSGVSAISTLYNEEEPTDPAQTRADYYNCGYKIWGRALANFSELLPGASEAGYYGDLYGVIVGAEQVLNNMTRGLSLAYAHNSTKPGEKDVQNYHGTMDSFNLAAYGSLTSAHLFVDGMMGYTYNRAKDNRTIDLPNQGSIPGFWDTADKSYSIHALNASLRGGAMYYISEYRFMPTIGVDYGYYALKSSQEHWSDGSAGLLFHSTDYHQLTTPLALSISRDFVVGKDDVWLLSPEIRGSWAHQWTDDQFTVGISYPGVGYYHDMTSQSYGRNIYSVGLGLVARYDNRINFVGTYDYRWQDRFRVHNFNVGVDFIF